MRNYIYTHVKLRRIDICDLLIAVDHVLQDNPYSSKWTELHEALKDSLKELDYQIDTLLEESEGK